MIISAFANGAGGILLFRVTDDKRIVGLSDIKNDIDIIGKRVKEFITPSLASLLTLPFFIYCGKVKISIVLFNVLVVCVICWCSIKNLLIMQII